MTENGRVQKWQITSSIIHWNPLKADIIGTISVFNRDGHSIEALFDRFYFSPGADLDHVTYGLWRTKILPNCSKSFKIVEVLVLIQISIQIWRTRKSSLKPPLKSILQNWLTYYSLYHICQQVFKILLILWISCFMSK